MPSPEWERGNEAAPFGHAPSGQPIYPTNPLLYEIREDINALLASLRRGLAADIRDMLAPALERQDLFLRRNESLLERLLEVENVTLLDSEVEPASPTLPYTTALADMQSPEQQCCAETSLAKEAYISVGSSAIDTPVQEHRSSRLDRESKINKAMLDKRPNLAIGNPDPVNLFQINTNSAFKVGNVDEHEYNVVEFYKDTGFVQAIARNETFGNITLAMITANAIYIGVDMDNNTAKTFKDADFPYQISEQIFALFFVFEWGVRFFAFADKRDCLKDMWFKFDTGLVVLLVGESWLVPIVLAILSSQSGGFEFSMGPLRLLRLLRLARITRLMRALPELAIMVKGIYVASRAVGSSMLMLILIVYIFAIIIFAMVGDDERVQDWFKTLPLCMWTLMLDGVFMDSVGGVLDALLEIKSFHTICLFAVFVVLGQITILNMLIGVLCEVVTAVGDASNEEIAVSTVKRTVLVMLKALDEDQSGYISKEEFAHVVQDPNAVAVLEGLNVDVNHLLELQQMLYKKPGSALTIAQVMEIILAARGDRPATVQDVIDQTTFIRFTILKAFAGHEDGMRASLSRNFKALPRIGDTPEHGIQQKMRAPSA